MLPGDKELERLARESYRGHSDRKPQLEGEVFVWIDLADDSAISFASICRAAEAGNPALAEPDPAKDITEARTYWVPEAMVQVLTTVPPGVPTVIRIVAYDGKRGRVHWCTVDS
jgi:hypothetical protein